MGINKSIIKKAILELIKLGVRQGYLTYAEIDEVLSSEPMLSREEIDETFMIFDKMEIEIIKEKKGKLIEGEFYSYDEDFHKSCANIIYNDVGEESLEYFRKHPDELRRISPRNFEEIIALIFENNGFKVELTPQTCDKGIDIIAVRNDILTGDDVHLIECKRHKSENKVGIGIVQRMIGVVEVKKANMGHIVTTSFFSSHAINEAKKHKTRLKLDDYMAILNWLNSLAKNEEN